MQGSQASTYHQRRVALDQLQPSIPARYYFDPQHYERELEVFWYGMWVMAGREEEVPEPRDYKVLKIGSQSIVILRDLDGYQDGGAAWEAILRPLNEAGDREAVMMADATAAFGNLVERAFPGRQKRTLYQPVEIKAIGKSLECSEDSARAHVFQALKKIRRGLDELASMDTEPVR